MYKLEIATSVSDKLDNLYGMESGAQPDGQCVRLC